MTEIVHTPDREQDPFLLIRISSEPWGRMIGHKVALSRRYPYYSASSVYTGNYSSPAQLGTPDIALTGRVISLFIGRDIEPGIPSIRLSQQRQGA